jgi:hypothetical protein
MLAGARTPRPLPPWFQPALHHLVVTIRASTPTGKDRPLPDTSLDIEHRDPREPLHHLRHATFANGVPAAAAARARTGRLSLPGSAPSGLASTPKECPRRSSGLYRYRLRQSANSQLLRHARGTAHLSPQGSGRRCPTRPATASAPYRPTQCSPHRALPFRASSRARSTSRCGSHCQLDSRIDGPCMKSRWHVLHAARPPSSEQADLISSWSSLRFAGAADDDGCV